MVVRGVRTWRGVSWEKRRRFFEEQHQIRLVGDKNRIKSINASNKIFNRQFGDLLDIINKKDDWNRL